MFYDPRLVQWGQGVRTRFEDPIVPSKSLLTNCVPELRAGDWQPRLWREDDMLTLYDPQGGRVAGSEFEKGGELNMVPRTSDGVLVWP